MGKTIRKWLRRILLAVGVFCLFMAFCRAVENAGGEESYDHAAQIAFHMVEDPAYQEPKPTRPPEKTIQWIPEPVEEDEHITRLSQIDLEALQEVNPEVVGWIFIPGTKIDYPILHGEDNVFYLKHTWEKVKNPMGSIFMEPRNTGDFSEFNTILYGHNMNNGSMFADLKDFSITWFREDTPYFYIATEDGVFRYEVFSFYKTPVSGFVYKLSFNQRKTREDFIEEALDASYADMGVVPSYTDRVVTLSTCSGDTHEFRWVVLGRMKMMRVEE